MEKLTIYWAPSYAPRKTQGGATLRFNMSYPEPVNLFKDLVKHKEKRVGMGSQFNCPAVSDRMKSSFVFKNNLHTEFSWDFSNPDTPIVTTKQGIHASFYKQSSVVGGAAVSLDAGWIFFAEEPTTIHLNPPVFHKPTDLSTKAYFPSGRIDASAWFRPMAAEIQTFEAVGEITIEEGDPLFYLEVLTDRPVELVRFDMSEELRNLMIECTSSPMTHGSRLPLVARYKRFKETRMHEFVLKEIKKNLI
jgi:hypothetical protein